MDWNKEAEKRKDRLLADLSDRNGVIDWNKEAEKRKDRLLADLFALLRINSVKDLGTSGPGKPMGEGISEALNYMLRLGEEAGFETKDLQGYAGYAEYAPSESGDYVAVLCHLDVVPASGEWTAPPFEPEIRDGQLYARGAIDDKGPAMAAFYALKIVKELGLPAKHNVRLIFGTDEEHACDCMTMYRKLEKPPICGFTPDAEFPIVRAEKGQINVKVLLTASGDSDSEGRADGSEFCLKAFHGGGTANMVPENAVAFLEGEEANLEALAAGFTQYCMDKGMEGSASREDKALTLRLKGVSAHGMEPHLGRNAALELLHFLRRLSLQPDAERYVACVNDHLHGDCLGHAFGVAMSDDVTGALTINCGILEYAPGEPSFFHLNLRYPACGTSDFILDHISKRVASYGFQVDTPILKNPHHVPDEYPMIRMLQRVYEEETGREPALLSTGGGTYGALIPNGVAFGMEFPGTKSTAHQGDETVSVEQLIKATAIYARAIYELANLDFEPNDAGGEGG
ncbi:dipeptidase PepV [Cohnella sp. AR92]|nr:dipeptidase PepV [Cohnella sp. AR92]